MSGDPKNYLDKFTELVYSIKTLRICDIRLPVTVSNRLSAQQSEIFTEFPLKSSIKPMKSVLCFFRNVKRS